MQLPDMIDAFVEEQRLPVHYGPMAMEHFVPLIQWLRQRHTGISCMLLGINGAQGTGKSTLAEFIVRAARLVCGWNVVALSLDDFYLTAAERAALAAEQHPLFGTRGVPGTHDTHLLSTSLQALARLQAGEEFPVPRFDKSVDDRAPKPWPVVEGPVDMVILEGWCVGTPVQANADLTEPINALERERDPDGRWRMAVNLHLGKDYAEIFQLLDALVFLKAPSFEAIFEWRLEQEQKLADKAGASAAGIMDAEAIRNFIAYYERLTRHNLQTLDDGADVVLTLGADHAVTSSSYR